MVEIINPSNPKLNQIRLEDGAAHSWYRFVLSYPPHIVQDYIKKFGINYTHKVLDPFCGTGTTIVECKKLGIESFGVEANPMAWFAASVKLDWNINPDKLLSNAIQIAERANDVIENEKTLRTLPAESQKIILKNSISPLPLHKTLVLLEQIKILAEVVGIDLFRTRLSTATKEQMREEVVLLRWSGKMASNSYPFSDKPGARRLF